MLPTSILLLPIVEVVIISVTESLSKDVGLVVSVSGVIVQGVDVVVRGVSSDLVTRVPGTTESNLSVGTKLIVSFPCGY